MDVRFLLTLALYWSMIQESRPLEWYEENNPHFLNGPEIASAIHDPNSIKIIKFFSPHCGYCRFIKGYMDEYKQNNDIDEHLKFYEINCPNNIQICIREYQIRAYPSVQIFDNTGERIGRYDGMYEK